MFPIIIEQLLILELVSSCLDDLWKWLVSFCVSTFGVILYASYKLVVPHMSAISCLSGYFEVKLN